MILKRFGETAECNIILLNQYIQVYHNKNKTTYFNNITAVKGKDITNSGRKK